MPRLNQIIAIAQGKKTQAQGMLTIAHHKLQKLELLSGIHRTYQPREENGDQLPPEDKNMQTSVNKELDQIKPVLIEWYDVVATQESSNQQANASITIDGRNLLENVPVGVLLFLEKQCKDLNTLITKLPTLDPSERWTYDDNADEWRSEPHNTVKTRKTPRHHVLVEATPDHPAQAELYWEDMPMGDWTTIKSSGAITAVRRNNMLNRIQKLTNAIKMAREQANSIDANNQEIGGTILNYIFGEDE